MMLHRAKNEGLKCLLVLVLEVKLVCRLLGRMITLAKFYFLQILHINHAYITKYSLIRK